MQSRTAGGSVLGSIQSFYTAKAVYYSKPLQVTGSKGSVGNLQKHQYHWNYQIVYCPVMSPGGWEPFMTHISIIAHVSILGLLEQVSIN